MKPDSVKAGYTFTDPNMIGEVDEYFYHGDHISSVVLVTDKKAKIVQQFAYMPFGELLVDNSTVDLDYRFSAKETDRESGLGYFGARYYDNTSAMWLGVDPLWEKYAGMNPYNYCAGNPVMLVDPEGRASRKPYLTNKDMGKFDKSCTPNKSNRRTPVKKEPYKLVRYTTLDIDGIPIISSKNSGSESEVGTWLIEIPTKFSNFSRDAFDLNGDQFMHDFEDQVKQYDDHGNIDVNVTITFNVDISQQEKNDIESNVYQYMQSNGINGQIEYQTIIDPEQSSVYTIDIIDNNSITTSGTYYKTKNNEQE